MIRQADGRMVARQLPSEAESSFNFPEGMDLQQATLAVIDAMRFHMDRDAFPVWIESDSRDLKRLLCDHYGVAITNKRPGDWAIRGAV
jgi:hypothetical protein